MSEQQFPDRLWCSDYAHWHLRDEAEKYHIGCPMCGGSGGLAELVEELRAEGPKDNDMYSRGYQRALHDVEVRGGMKATEFW